MTMLIANTKYAANTDRALIYTVTNNNMGMIGAFLAMMSISTRHSSKATSALLQQPRKIRPSNLKI